MREKNTEMEGAAMSNLYDIDFTKSSTKSPTVYVTCLPYHSMSIELFACLL